MTPYLQVINMKIDQWRGGRYEGGRRPIKSELMAADTKPDIQ